MSIASEITRLQGAKADLKTAIEGKGVTVPAAALLDDYADLVDAIQTGGGGSYPNVMQYKEIIVESTSTNIDVQLEPSDNCSVLLIIKDVGTPDSSLFKTLFWAAGWSNGSGFTTGHAILRPNGTIGSDSSCASFNISTGVLSFGNAQYGKAITGDTYYVYQFSLGT